MMIPTLIGISLLSFVIISLPPGSYLDAHIARVQATGEEVSREEMEMLKARYGLDKPLPMQYVTWMKNIFTRGDFGVSFDWNKPVGQLIWDRLGLTVALSLCSMLLTWSLAFPVAVFSAVKQYSIGDYLLTFLSFVGLATPNFLLALILMFLSFKYLDTDVGGLFSAQYAGAPWSWPKFLDLLKHIWVPAVILGISGTAGLIRTVRANLLDELHKPYVRTARAKGMPEARMLIKYPLRLALNPFFSTIGWSLSGLVSGATIISVVLSLPTTGPLLLRALQGQDMYLAGTFIMLLSTLTVIGTLVSDIVLAAVDPRIRMGGQSR